MPSWLARWRGDADERIDVALYAAIAQTPTPALDRLLAQVSHAADYSRPWVASAAILAAVGGERGRSAATAGLASVAVAAALVNLGVKPLGRRRRPDRVVERVPVARHTRMPASTSFPSGHSATAFAFATGVGHVLPSTAIPLRGLAAVVAYSRVHTGVHYPGDVVAGSAGSGPCSRNSPCARSSAARLVCIGTRIEPESDRAGVRSHHPIGMRRSLRPALLLAGVMVHATEAARDALSRMRCWSSTGIASRSAVRPPARSRWWPLRRTALRHRRRSGSSKASFRSMPMANGLRPPRPPRDHDRLHPPDRTATVRLRPPHGLRSAGLAGPALEAADAGGPGTRRARGHPRALPFTRSARSRVRARRSPRRVRS